MIEIKKISRECNIRTYTYTAHISKATGRLIKITAGCRAWKTFAAAELHYQTGDWKDGNPTHPDRYGRRAEVRAILHRLEDLVAVYQSACRVRRRAKR